MADLKKLFAKKEQPSEAVPAAAEQATPAVKPTGIKLGFKAAGKPAAQPAVLASQAERQEPQQIDSLDDLANLEVAAIPEVSPRVGFADETPATAPLRDLPDDLSQSQKQFVDLIDGIYQIVHEPDMLGTVIKSIMIELKSNPQYMKLVAPDDVRTWIRAMRENMGLARIQKAETKAKRANGGGRKSGRVNQDMLDDLKDLGLVQ